MKKILAVALTSVFAVAAFAIESDPSNTVGFISQTLEAGFSTFAPCPIGAGPSVNALDYISGQGSAGDKIYKWENGGWSQYPYSNWSTLTFEPGVACLYNNTSGSNQSLVIAGDVIPEGTTVAMGTIPAGIAAWGNPLPMDIDLDTDDLGLGLADGDKIFAWETGGWSPFTKTAGVYAVDFLAGEAYLIKAATEHVWEYTIGGAPVAVAPVQVKKVSRAKVRTIN